MGERTTGTPNKIKPRVAPSFQKTALLVKASLLHFFLLEFP